VVKPHAIVGPVYAATVRDGEEARVAAMFIRAEILSRGVK
jgi:hypothetical protein